jgi:hypothetical protein
MTNAAMEEIYFLERALHEGRGDLKFTPFRSGWLQPTWRRMPAAKWHGYWQTKQGYDVFEDTHPAKDQCLRQEVRRG